MVWKTDLPALEAFFSECCVIGFLQILAFTVSKGSRLKPVKVRQLSSLISRAIKIPFFFWLHLHNFLSRNFPNSLWSRGAARWCCWLSRAETQRLSNWKHPEGDHWQNYDWYMINRSVIISHLLEMYWCLLQRWLTSPVRRLSQGKADGQKKPPIRTRRRDNRPELATPLIGNAQVVQRCEHAVCLNAICNECWAMMSSGATADGFQTKGKVHLHLETLKWGRFAAPLRWSSLASLKPSQMEHSYRF